MLPTPANFQAEHISAEKRDCSLIACGSLDLGRLQAAPTVQPSADAPRWQQQTDPSRQCAARRQGQASCGLWQSLAPPVSQSQGHSRPHASDGDSILVAGGRSRGDSSLRREGLGTKLSFSKGWEASAAQLATLTGQPAARPVWLCSGKLHAAEPLAPCTGQEVSNEWRRQPDPLFPS